MTNQPSHHQCPPCRGDCRQGRDCERRLNDDLPPPFDRRTTRFILLGLACLWIALGGVVLGYLWASPW